MKEEFDKIGKTGIITLAGLSIQVRIVDIKFSWGRFRYTITPIAGSGEINVEKVKMLE